MATKKNKKTSAEILGSIEGVEKLIYGKYKLAVKNLHFYKILEQEIETFNPSDNNTLMQKAEYMMCGSYLKDQLKTLESILPIQDIVSANNTTGKIKKYSSFLHNIWVTDPEKPRDMISYKAILKSQNPNLAEDIKEIRPLYNSNKYPVAVDDQYNSFIQSVKNFDQGVISSKLPLTEDKMYHVFWTNLSLEDLNSHKELTSLRKICGIDQSHTKLPEFILLNINDVMDKNASEVQNLAKLSMPLPEGITQALPQIRKDLLSVRPVLTDMIQKKMFASISDVIRIAAIKDIGGTYFDLDCILFDQDLVHSEQKKYNLFDIMKNYNCIIGKELHGYAQCANGFISNPQPNSEIMHEAWNIIYRNITRPNEVPYIKYSASGWSKIICQTGPVALTLAFIKKCQEQDIMLAPGKLIHIADPSIDSVGVISYDVCGGTWVADANPSIAYVLYDENDNGITYEQLLAMK